MKARDVEAKERIEIEFWRDSKEESPEADSLTNIINKVTDAGVFLHCIGRHRDSLHGLRDGRFLELGGGQGWASCVLKRTFPSAHITTTDISEYAVMSLPKWESLFNVSLDNAYACKSYAINEDDSSLDFVFCFAAAHHFLAHRRTLEEISRVLKPGGVAIYFFEPTAPKYLYSLAHWRVNRKRPEVPEDVLIVSELGQLALDAGLSMSVDYDPSLVKRGPIETVYYLILSLFPWLQKLLPCTANVVFVKPSAD